MRGLVVGFNKGLYCRPLVQSVNNKYLSYFSTKTNVVGTQKNPFEHPKHMLKVTGKIYNFTQNFFVYLNLCTAYFCVS